MIRKIFLIAIVAALLCSVSVMAYAQSMPIDNKTYVEDEMNQLMTGGIIELPGGHLVNYSSDGKIINSMNNLQTSLTDDNKTDIVACYQRFGYSSWEPDVHLDWPRTGRIWASVNEINNLPSNESVYWAVHQINETWLGEQAIIIVNSANHAEFRVWSRDVNNGSSFAHCRDSDMNGNLTNTYIVAIVAVNDLGSIDYNQVRFYIWDLNTNISYQYQCDLPNTTKLGWVDGTLEAKNEYRNANNVQYTLNDLSAYDNNFQPLTLQYYYVKSEVNNNVGSQNHTMYNRYNDPVYQQKPDGSYNATLVQWKEPDFGQGQYWKFINVSGSGDGALSDYQVKLVIHRGNGTDSGSDIYLNGLSQSWPYDIRFTNATFVDQGHKLSYWVESYDANTATVWVKVDYIAASPAVTPVKLFYGRPNDTGESDGNNTFIVFDHFDGASLDSNKWVVQGTGSYSMGNSNIRLSASNSIVQAHCINNITLDKYTIETQGKVILPYYYQGYKYRPGVLFKQGNTSPNDNALGFDTYSFDQDGWTVYNFPQWSWYSITSPASISPSDPYSGVFRIQITVNGASYTCKETLRNKVISGSNSPSGTYFSLMAEKCTNDYDWVFVRKYTPNEPGQSHAMRAAYVSIDTPITSISDQSHNVSTFMNRTIPAYNDIKVNNSTG